MTISYLVRGLTLGLETPQAVAEMLQPVDAPLMKRYPVSSRVNSVKNHDAECAAAEHSVQVALPLD
jgi:hypothetical protein